MVPGPAARNARHVMLLAGAGHFAAHFFELMFPTLSVALARDAQVPIHRVWGWSGVGYLAFGLGAVPASLIAERVSARLLLLASLFGVGVSALAASEATAPRALTISLGLMGAAASVYHPAGSSLIARAGDRRGRGLDVAGGAAAVALTPVLTATLCALLGWRNALRVAGYALCALAVACAFLRLHEPPRRFETAAARPTPITWRPLLVLLVAAALAGMSYRGATLLQPAYFAVHVSPVWFGAALSAAYTLACAGDYAGGALAGRADPRRPYLACLLAGLPALAVTAVSGGAPLVLCAAVFVFCSLAAQPIEDGLVARYAPPNRRAAIHGLRLLCTYGIGSLAVWLVCWADAAHGLPFAILCLAGVVTMGALAATVLLRMDDRPTAGTPPLAAEAGGAARTQPGSPLAP